LRKKWYSENLSSKSFENGFDNEKGDILILLRKDQEEMPLELKEFYKDINS